MQQPTDSIPRDNPRRQTSFDEPFWSSATVEAIAAAKQLYIVPNEADASILYDVLDIPALGVRWRRLPQVTLDRIEGADTIYTFLTKSPPDLAYKIELGLHLHHLGWRGKLQVAPLDPELSIQSLWKIGRNVRQEGLDRNVRRASDGLPPLEVDERYFEATITKLLAESEAISIARLTRRRGRAQPKAGPERSFPRLGPPTATGIRRSAGWEGRSIPGRWGITSAPSSPPTPTACSTPRTRST